jgi:hypothetical protein
MMRNAVLLSLAAALALAGCGASPAPDTVRQDATPPAAAPSAPTVAGFDKTLAWQGIGFRVSSPNDSSIGMLKIQPSGLAGANEAITREVDGRVVGAEVADLDANGSPELYVFVQSAGSGSYGSLVALGVNGGKSLSEVFLPDLAEDPRLSEGYQGHDEFAVLGNALERRFPVYRPGDTNAAPSGGTRRVQYRLEKGEAGWVLRPEASGGP